MTRPLFPLVVAGPTALLQLAGEASPFDEGERADGEVGCRVSCREGVGVPLAAVSALGRRATPFGMAVKRPGPGDTG